MYRDILSRLAVGAVVVAVGLVAGPAWGTVLDANGTGFDNLVPAGSPQDDGGLLDDWGTLSDSGISGYNTPNVSVTWPDHDPNPGVGTNHFFTNADHIDWTPNDTFLPITQNVVLQADPGFVVRLDSMKQLDGTAGKLNVGMSGATVSFPFPHPGVIDTTSAGYNQWVSFNWEATTASLNSVFMDDISFSQLKVIWPKKTTLDFDGLGFDRLIGPGSEQTPNGAVTLGADDTFGSNAVGNPLGVAEWANTPNVTVLWGETNSVSGNNSTDHFYQYQDDLRYTDNDGYASGNRRQTSDVITLTAATGPIFRLDSVDFIYGSAAWGRVLVTVDGGPQMIFDPGQGSVGQVHQLDLSSAGFGRVITLAWDSPSGIAADYRIDNLTFSLVPEPSSMVLLALAMLGLLGCGRRFRRGDERRG